MSQTLTQPTGSQQPAEQDKRVVNHLFKKLRGIFPAWRNSIKTEEELSNTRREWYYALVDAGISTIEQIDDGVKFARQYDSPYWPSCGMFIKWCNEGTIQRLGVPDKHDCKKLLIKYSNDPKVRLDRYSYWIWRNFDSYKFKSATAKESDRHFDYYYRKMIGLVVSGEGVFSEQPALIQPKPEPEVSEEEKEKLAKDNIGKIKEVLGNG